MRDKCPSAERTILKCPAAAFTLFQIAITLAVIGLLYAYALSNSRRVEQLQFDSEADAKAFPRASLTMPFSLIEGKEYALELHAVCDPTIARSLTARLSSDYLEIGTPLDNQKDVTGLGTATTAERTWTWTVTPSKHGQQSLDVRIFKGGNDIATYKGMISVSNQEVSTILLFLKDHFTAALSLCGSLLIILWAIVRTIKKRRRKGRRRLIRDSWSHALPLLYL